MNFQNAVASLSTVGGPEIALGLVTRLWPGRLRNLGSVASRGRFYSILSHVQTKAGFCKALYPKGVGKNWPRRETDHSPSPRSEVQNVPSLIHVAS